MPVGLTVKQTGLELLVSPGRQALDGALTGPSGVSLLPPLHRFLLHPSPGPYAVLTKDTMPQTYKRKRSWSRAVFSNLQRKGLEKRFEIQKYVTKPDRKQLAAMLGLTDAQVSRLPPRRTAPPRAACAPQPQEPLRPDPLSRSGNSRS